MIPNAYHFVTGVLKWTKRMFGCHWSEQHFFRVKNHQTVFFGEYSGETSKCGVKSITFYEFSVKRVFFSGKGTLRMRQNTKLGLGNFKIMNIILI